VYRREHGGTKPLAMTGRSKSPNSIKFLEKGA